MPADSGASRIRMCVCCTPPRPWPHEERLTKKEYRRAISGSGAVRCACASRCGDVPEKCDHPRAVCKGLPVAPRPPLVELRLVPRG